MTSQIYGAVFAGLIFGVILFVSGIKTMKRKKLMQSLPTSKIFKKILSVERNAKNESTIVIKDPNVAKNIFEAYGDPAKKIILDINKSMRHQTKFTNPTPSITTKVESV